VAPVCRATHPDKTIRWKCKPIILVPVSLADVVLHPYLWLHPCLQLCIRVCLLISTGAKHTFWCVFSLHRASSPRREQGEIVIGLMYPATFPASGCGKPRGHNRPMTHRRPRGAQDWLRVARCPAWSCEPDYPTSHATLFLLHPRLYSFTFRLRFSYPFCLQRVAPAGCAPCGRLVDVGESASFLGRRCAGGREFPLTPFPPPALKVPPCGGTFFSRLWRRFCIPL
jgi:hypothetical protein